jgi:hypothetical protein
MTTTMPDAHQPSPWERIFTSTGQPPAWALVGYLLAGLVAGAALGGGLP